MCNQITFDIKTNFPEGDCIPMSCDGGKTWCVEYDYIKAHPEKDWKSWIEISLKETKTWA